MEKEKTARSISVSSLTFNSLSALASSRTFQDSEQDLTKATAKKHWSFNKTSYLLSLTPNTLKSANPTAVPVRKRLMLLTKMRQRTEPSSFRDQFQCLRPSAELKLVRPEKTAKEFQRSRLSAKLTTLRVDLVPNSNASKLQYVLLAVAMSRVELLLLREVLVLLEVLDQFHCFRWSIKVPILSKSHEKCELYE